MFGSVDWAEVFIPQTPLLEIIVRGAVTYLVLYALLRFVRRQVGSLSVNDLLVLVLIADAAQNAMAGEYKSVSDGVLLVAVIIGIATSMNWLGFHVPWLQRVVHPDAVPLVKDGQPDEATLRRYMVTREELMTQLRLQGVAELTEVQAAYVEGNGQISVLTEEHESRGTAAQSMADAM
ncbi:MAG TPA: YetF domain-containing protein [Candidatus Limnocylindria bacterium]|nr:YetF domain-containing protein [Candidatus Limnocylindria bacterium]